MCFYSTKYTQKIFQGPPTTRGSISYEKLHVYISFNAPTLGETVVKPTNHPFHQLPWPRTVVQHQVSDESWGSGIRPGEFHVGSFRVPTKHRFLSRVALRISRQHVFNRPEGWLFFQVVFQDFSNIFWKPLKNHFKKTTSPQAFQTRMFVWVWWEPTNHFSGLIFQDWKIIIQLDSQPFIVQQMANHVPGLQKESPL